MSTITAKDYLDRLKTYRKNVYVKGRIVERDDPMLLPGINVVQETFRAAQDPETREMVVTRSHLTGEEISRYTHVNLTLDDLLKKQEMTRSLCHKVGGCIQRCMGTDTINALGVVTKEIDDVKGTEYHDRFQKFLEYYQKNDLVGNSAQTDAKGDRSKRPGAQIDPDLYLHIVKKTSGGIIVRGAKVHNSMGPYSDEIIVLPTRVMLPEEADYAVSFSIPADTKGIKLICHVANVRPAVDFKAPFNTIGLSDSFTIFDDVFVPWERVFMCGEWEFAGRLALLFANYHRHTFSGCKPAVTDIFMGATALAAEYNGVSNAKHIQQDIAELITLAELVYASGIAAAVKGQITSSGIYEPASLYSNLGRYLAGKNIYYEYETLAATAGGMPATLPFEQDWLNSDTKHYLEKYVMRNPKVSPESQYRLFRFIADYTCSSWGGVYQYGGIHGGGSPIMEQIGIRNTYDLEPKKKIVKHLAGIKE